MFTITAATKIEHIKNLTNGHGIHIGSDASQEQMRSLANQQQPYNVVYELYISEESAPTAIQGIPKHVFIIYILPGTTKRQMESLPPHIQNLHFLGGKSKKSQDSSEAMQHIPDSVLSVYLGKNSKEELRALPINAMCKISVDMKTDPDSIINLPEPINLIWRLQPPSYSDDAYRISSIIRACIARKILYVGYFSKISGMNEEQFRDAGIATFYVGGTLARDIQLAQKTRIASYLKSAESAPCSAAAAFSQKKKTAALSQLWQEAPQDTNEGGKPYTETNDRIQFYITQ